MPIIGIRAEVVDGNVRYTKATDRTAIVGGIAAVSGSTTVAAADLVIPVTHRYVAKTTGAGAEALTMANGVPGQLITISVATAGGGTSTLTPATSTGFATILFVDQKDTATLQYVDDTIGWVLIGYFGTAAPPVVS